MVEVWSRAYHVYKHQHYKQHWVLSKTCFVHRALITNNTGSFGGEIHSDNSKKSIPYGQHLLVTRLIFGSGIYLVYGKVDINLFMRNTAQGDGGAILALGTDILLNCTIHFTSNSAQNGGAVCLKSSATVSISAQFHLSTSHNHAAEYGGVVHSEDNTVPSGGWLSSGEKSQCCCFLT